MGLYRKKPVVIKAEQFWIDQTPWPEGVTAYEVGGTTRYYIDTLEGRVLNVIPGDWIITGVHGEKYPCKAEIFEQTYDVEAAKEALPLVANDIDKEAVLVLGVTIGAIVAVLGLLLLLNM